MYYIVVLSKNFVAVFTFIYATMYYKNWRVMLSGIYS